MARKFQTGKNRREAGFTLLELLVVLMIVGLIAAIAAPNISSAVTRAREAALAENLSVMRRAIDDYYSDNTGYPEDLGELVDRGYLRHIPDDPVAGSGSQWATQDATDGGIIDVRSGENEKGLNDVPYNEW